MFDRTTKMNLPEKQFSTFAAALLACSAMTAQAAEVDTSAWVCKRCPFEDGYRSQTTAEISNVSDDAARFGDATGYDEKGVYVNVGGNGSLVTADHQLYWQIEDLGLDSRSVSVEGGKQGHYDLRFAYQQLPRHVFDQTRTVFAPASGNSLVLPGDWVAAGTTGGFSALASSLRPIAIESERKVLELGADYIPSTKLMFFADYRRQSREGVDITAGTFYTQSSLLPRPIDYETDEVDLGLLYRFGDGHVKLAWYASTFDDANTGLYWSNPFTSNLGNDQAALAQPPDNSFRQAVLSGAWHWPEYSTSMTFSAARGLMEQNEQLLPYTSNSGVLSATLPRASLDGEVETSNLALAIVSRPFKGARLKVSYRVDERDNQTPVEQWSRVITDTFNTLDLESNIPYSFERSRLSASATYRVRGNIKVSAGYDRTDHDRDFQEVASQTEDAGWGELSWQPFDLLDLRVKGGSSERTIDRYNETYAVSLGQNPLMRKFNLAYRYREFGEFSATATLPEKPVSLTLSASYADDDYSYALLGLNNAENRQYAADLSWAVSEKASLYLLGGLETIDSTQSGSTLFSYVDWQAFNTDEYRTVGGGLKLKQLSDKVDLNLSAHRARGTSDIRLVSTIDGASRFPTIRSDLDSLRLGLVYHKSEKLDVGLNLRYESFQADDWALAGVAPDTVQNVLGLGAEEYDYDVLMISIGVRYLIGPKDSK
jgi:MtrB/PioB family decaheme-associated outer membrane protein